MLLNTKLIFACLSIINWNTHKILTEVNISIINLQFD